MEREHENGWNEWSKHVLRELVRLNACYETLDTRLNDVRLEIVQLKVKSGIWGLVGGAIPVVVLLAFLILKGTP